MNKIISFSLFGDKQYYIDGAIENAKMSSLIFPEWKCRFYVDKNIDISYVNQLKNLGSEVIIKERRSKCKFEAISWRFLAASDSDIMICRDVDSTLLQRDKFAVDEWLNSDKDFHIIRDYNFSAFRILGGTWGCRNGILSNMTELLENWKYHYMSADDMVFLNIVIYPKISNNVFIHDEYGYFKDEEIHRINFAPEIDNYKNIGYKL